MLTANVSEIKKSVLSNFSFILNVLSEDRITFVCMGLYIDIKKY